MIARRRAGCRRFDARSSSPHSDLGRTTRPRGRGRGLGSPRRIEGRRRRTPAVEPARIRVAGDRTLLRCTAARGISTKPLGVVAPARVRGGRASLPPLLRFALCQEPPSGIELGRHIRDGRENPGPRARAPPRERTWIRNARRMPCRPHVAGPVLGGHQVGGGAREPATESSVRGRRARRPPRLRGAPSTSAGSTVRARSAPRTRPPARRWPDR